MIFTTSFLLFPLSVCLQFVFLHVTLPTITIVFLLDFYQCLCCSVDICWVYLIQVFFFDIFAPSVTSVSDEVSVVFFSLPVQWHPGLDICGRKVSVPLHCFFLLDEKAPYQWRIVIFSIIFRIKKFYIEGLNCLKELTLKCFSLFLALLWLLYWTVSAVRAVFLNV
jgi:hypothetical protein